jgi:hypothetical protein
MKAVYRTSILAAAALLAVSASVPKAQAACIDGESCTTLAGGATIAGYAAGAAWTLFLGNLVVKDIAAGGLHRGYAEVTPGAGYVRPVAALAHDAELVATFQATQQRELASAK